MRDASSAASCASRASSLNDVSGATPLASEFAAVSEKQPLADRACTCCQSAGPLEAGASISAG
jgi:hypothetical protein